MIKLFHLFLLFLTLSPKIILGQNINFGFELSLNPVSVTGLPGLHSYAYAQHDGKWLIIGGRKDGLHARQPFNAFPASQNNTQIFVVDVNNNSLWSSSLSLLPTAINEQLQSTNMNFYQDGASLFIIGGYGFSPTQNDHITYPYLTSIDVSGLMNAIINNLPVSSYFKQLQNTNFAVTGGHLKKLNDTFYLVGGHRFDGRYNPMGNPTFTQEYTNQIRKFQINNSGSSLSISNYTTITDPVHLHRRDYNLLPQIFPNGELGFTISSGVFQVNADLPFLYPVDIKETGYTPNTIFNQYLSNYHSATACLYDATANNMHSLFFGGMSQYYYQNGSLIQDNLVPFVKTISRLTRNNNGVLTEYQMPIEMPALKGSGSEFIPNLNLPHYSNKVFRLNDITDNSFKIGHIYGGIQSTASNPFSSNNTSVTSADPTIYEVWLTKTNLSTNDHIINGENPYQVQLSPNPYKDDLYIKIKAPRTTHAHYFISDNAGRMHIEGNIKNVKQGEKQYKLKLDSLKTPELYYFTIVFEDKFYNTEKIIKSKQ